MKDTNIYTLATLGVIAALSYAIAVIPVQAQAPGPQYYSYAPYVPPANNTTPVPPANNNTLPEPPMTNGTEPEIPEVPGNDDTTVVVNGSIFVSARTIHSSRIHDGVEGVFLLPPVSGFQWSGDIIWSSSANVTLVVDGDTLASPSEENGASSFTGQSLSLHSLDAEPFDVTYSLRADFKPTTAPTDPSTDIPEEEEA
ncbi:hypothetical protein [Nitrososphaera viennensis]|nr:hypothetical protein [Nitrososphaera viennensis]UVS68028.1 hypothetical protein NWT39_08945 [Nitrososphaera viennensis]